MRARQPGRLARLPARSRPIAINRGPRLSAVRRLSCACAGRLGGRGGVQRPAAPRDPVARASLPVAPPARAMHRRRSVVVVQLQAGPGRAPVEAHRPDHRPRAARSEPITLRTRTPARVRLHLRPGEQQDAERAEPRPGRSWRSGRRAGSCRTRAGRATSAMTTRRQSPTPQPPRTSRPARMGGASGGPERSRHRTRRRRRDRDRTVCRSGRRPLSSPTAARAGRSGHGPVHALI